MPGGAAPHNNPLIAGSQRDPLADRCCHDAYLAHLELSGTARGPEQQEPQSHVQPGTMRANVPLVSIRPIRQGGKRCGSPGKHAVSGSSSLPVAGSIPGPGVTMT